jgi:hypothetical protein
VYEIFAIALIIVFGYFFQVVNGKYKMSIDMSNSREEAERELAASFIRNAIKQYELRHTRPDLQMITDFERLTDDQDDLVEAYFNRIKERGDSKVASFPLFSLGSK